MSTGTAGSGETTDDSGRGTGTEQGKAIAPSHIATPAPRPNTVAGRRKKLGLSNKPLPFKGTLKYAISSLPGGKSAFMDFARHVHDDEKIARFVYKYDSLSATDRRNFSLDEICEAVEVNPVDVLKAVVGIAYEVNSDVSNLVASVMHPQVVKASVKFAMKEGGHRDREMLHIHSNFIPTKGTQINVNANASAAAAAKTTVQGDDSGLPDFEESAIQTITVIRGDEK